MRRLDPAVDSSTSARSPGASQDALFSGQVTLFQPERGYKVTVDTLLLADFAARIRPESRHLVDLGAGVGSLALAFAHFARVGQASLVEREAPLVALAERNCAAARLPATTYVVDLARGLPAELGGVASVVLSNPPFFAPQRADPASTQRRRSRGGELAPFVRAAHRAMGRRAYAFFVYPAPALPELLEVARASELVPKRLRFVHAFAGSPARIALVEFRKAKPGGLVIEAPLVEWSAQNQRSLEVARVVRGDLPGSPR